MNFEMGETVHFTHTVLKKPRTVKATYIKPNGEKSAYLDFLTPLGIERKSVPVSKISKLKEER